MTWLYRRFRFMGWTVTLSIGSGHGGWIGFKCGGLPTPYLHADVMGRGIILFALK